MGVKDTVDDFDEYALYNLLTLKVMERYRDERQEICKLFIDRTIDLNQHRDLIQSLALFNVNEVDSYWTNKEREAKPT